MGFYIKKLLSLLTTLFLVSVITFLVFQILPGDPVAIILGPDADPLQAEAMRESLGLNRSGLERYIEWISGAIRGDLGMSIRYNQPVGELIISRLPITTSLAVMSLLLTLLIGIPLGLFVTRYDDTVLGKSISMLTQLGIAIPSFWSAIILIFIFAVTLDWLPSGGHFVAFSSDPIQWFKAIILPSLSIALGTSAILIRYLKTSMLDEKSKQYVKTALSKGLTEPRVLYTHVLKNSLIPTITILGMLVVDILGGSIITETVFNLPGLGNLIVASINSRDLPLIQGLVMYLATLVVTFNFLTDILYSIVDPRIKVR